jgi:hypothetical protein
MIDGSRACVISVTALTLPAAPSPLEHRPAGVTQIGLLPPQTGGDRADIWNLAENGLRFREGQHIRNHAGRDPRIDTI